MNFYIEYNQHSNFILITILDNFSVNLFSAILDEITSSKEYPSNSNAIYDLSKVAFKDVTVDVLEALAQSIISEEYCEARKGAKTVYVCPQDLQFGRIRQWMAYAVDVPVELDVTRTMKEPIALIER
jgi:hypothetical protein